MEITKKRIITIVLATALICSTFSFVTALTITDMGTEFLSFFTGTIQPSHFTASTPQYTISGHNRISIQVTILNTDTVTHSGLVTIQLLDADGDVITISGEQQQKTITLTDVEAGATQTVTASFNARGLVSQFETPSVQTSG